MCTCMYRMCTHIHISHFAKRQSVADLELRPGIFWVFRSLVCSPQFEIIWTQRNNNNDAKSHLHSGWPASHSFSQHSAHCMWQLWIQLGEWVLPLEWGLYELTDTQHGVHALTAMKHRTAGWPGHAAKEASFHQVMGRESWARTLKHRGYEVPLKAPSHSESRQSMLGHICVLKKGGSIFINLRGIGCIRKNKCFGLKLILLLFMKGGHWT